MGKIHFLLLLMTGLLAGAQEVPKVTIYYTGNTGKYFRKYPVPGGTIFKVQKSDPKQLREYLKRGTLRFAVTQEPLTGPGLKTVKLAFQAPILAVHPANPLRDISEKQARNLLENNRGSWRTFNGPSARIHLYIKAQPGLPPPVMQHDHSHERNRPRTILEPEPLGGKSAEEDDALPTVDYTRPLKIQTENDAKSFSLLFTDPFGLACFDITRFDENRVVLLKINHISPSLTNFRNGKYALTTIHYLIYPAQLADAEKKLLEYIRSKQFAKILFQDGLLPEMQEKAEK